jgi:hypothetical protein
MAKVFLSYSRKDAAKAQRFTQWLERTGHDVWRDEDDIGYRTTRVLRGLVQGFRPCSR